MAYNGQNYVWITNYNDSNDIEVTSNSGHSVKIEEPQQVIPLPEPMNTQFNEANNAQDDFKQQAMLNTIIKHFDLEQYMKQGSKSFWSISPCATQQEMVEKARTQFSHFNTSEISTTEH